MELRIALILVGIALLLALYFVGKRKRDAYRRQDEDFDFSSTELPDPLDPEPSAAPQINKDEADLLGTDHTEEANAFTIDQEAAVAQELGDISDLVREDIAESPRKASTLKHQPSLLEQQDEEISAQDEKLVILHVAARSPNTFDGKGILRLAKEFELEHDEMHIFSKNIERFSGIQSLYSIVNMVKPGTFDVHNMDQFETPGISFVMHLPGPEEGLKAFNIMLESARKFAERLNGDLLDETRTRISPQSIAHLQEDIQLFSLKNSRAYANK